MVKRGLFLLPVLLVCAAPAYACAGFPEDNRYMALAFYAALSVIFYLVKGLVYLVKTRRSLFARILATNLPPLAAAPLLCYASLPLKLEGNMGFLLWGIVGGLLFAAIHILEKKWLWPKDAPAPPASFDETRIVYNFIFAASVTLPLCLGFVLTGGGESSRMLC